MTTYILAGGNDRQYEEFGVKLAETVTSWVDQPKILSCFFARDESKWPEVTAMWSTWFEKYFGSSIAHKVASIDNFQGQIAWADVIYFHGGDTKQLVAAMERFDDFEKLFEGKVVIGSSAGANLLSGVYYSPVRDAIERGSGIVNVASIPHYDAPTDGDVPLDHAGWQDIIARTKEFADGEQILLLPEGTFVSFVK